MGLLNIFKSDSKGSNDGYEDFSENSGGYYDIDDIDDKPTFEKPVNQDAQTGSAVEAPAAKPASKPTVSLKLVKPYSPKEATDYIDMLKDNCIVVIDISALNRDGALRLIDYLSGAVYALEGDLKKTNQNTLVVAPKDVDISSMIPAVAAKTEETESEAEENE